MPPKSKKKVKKLVTGNSIEDAVGSNLLNKIGMDTVPDDDGSTQLDSARMSESNEA